MKYDGTNFAEVLREHGGALEGFECEEYADFSRCVLRDINFSDLNLSYASFSESIIIDCIFQNCDLTGTTFAATNIIRSAFVDTKLNQATMDSSVMHDVSFDHCEVDALQLGWANFRGCCFCAIDLSKASRTYTTTFIAPIFSDDSTPPDRPLACPSEGCFTGWKKAELESGQKVLVKLFIPASAKRSSAFSNKCRCNKAQVVGIYDFKMNPLPTDTVAYSIYDPSFEYEKDDIIVPIEPFDENRWHECASGIHFFLTPEEAKDYIF